MDKKFVSEIKHVLLQSKAKLEAELRQFGKHDSGTANELEAGFPDYGDKEDENAAEVATFSDNLALKRTLKGAFNDVQQALARIEKGTYGICKYCGNEIDIRRLLARPESSSCIACKTKQLQKR